MLTNKQRIHYACLCWENKCGIARRETINKKFKNATTNHMVSCSSVNSIHLAVNTKSKCNKLTDGSVWTCNYHRKAQVRSTFLHEISIQNTVVIVNIFSCQLIKKETLHATVSIYNGNTTKTSQQ